MVLNMMSREEISRLAKAPSVCHDLGITEPERQVPKMVEVLETLRQSGIRVPDLENGGCKVEKLLTELDAAKEAT